MSATDLSSDLTALPAPAEVQESHPLSPRQWRIWAVVPCYNRPRDLANLLADLAKLDLGDPASVDLRILIVDNASHPPLHDVEIPPGISVEFLRLPQNTGGSGGFNAGISEAFSRTIADQPADFLWLVDSDARVEPGALIELIRALDGDSTLAAAGSALVDPASGEVHETGGRLNRRTGRFGPAFAGPAPDSRPAVVDYIAACSALVRREAIERTGLMPDVFLNADDVEWFMRMARRAGKVVAVPTSRVAHPPMYRRPGAPFDRFQTWARYYIARNAFGPIDAARLGWRVRLIRALREVAGAVLQEMLGRADLARLHLQGLRDAAAGRRTGPAPDGIHFQRPRSLKELPAALREAGVGTDAKGAAGPDPATGHAAADIFIHPDLPPSARAIIDEALPGCSVARPSKGIAALPATLRRLIMGPRHEVAFVPANGRHDCWVRGRTMFVVAPDGFTVRTVTPSIRVDLVRAALRTAVNGARLSVRLAAGAGSSAGATITPVPRSRDFGSALPALALSIIILSYNRWSALEQTLRELAGASQSGPEGARPPRIIVVDNASTDGTPERLREAFPDVELIALDENRGAGAFNIGAAATTDDLLLILDDDARPDPQALLDACQLLARRPDLAAVALHPRHPSSQESEWAFAESLAGGVDDWPVMGCGNLVRREAWQQVGGYDDAFFLYRNDTDLAMKLLAAGHGVHFNPGWIVWHDSPAAMQKSLRWFELATRNWVWLCRRHGRGVGRMTSLAAGWMWAHRLARLNMRGHLCIARGAVRGIIERPPPLPAACDVDGRAMGRLMRLRFGRW